MSLSNQEKEKYIRRAAIFAALLNNNLSTGEIVNSKEYHYDKAPKKLYKYCRVNKNSISSIKDQYWWIAEVKSLDDQFEVTMDYVRNPEKLDEIIEEHNFFNYVVQLMQTTNPELKPVWNKVSRKLSSQYTLVEAQEVVARMTSDEKKKEALSEITGLFQNEDFISVNEKLMGYIVNFDKEIGLCSLCETNKSQIMWQMYGNSYKGIVIEYDMTKASNEARFSLIPVIYADSRDANPVKLYMDIMLGALNQTKEQLTRILYEWILRVISTKNKEWSLQEEWRVVGRPNNRMPSAPITAVYMGKDIAKTNREKIMRLSKKLGFKVYDQKEDYEHLKITFEEVKEG
ncbi:MAG: DUF2971 domain-containing protein [Erysipelotrichaceae bacterium]|nr:DUF2971 domain-containing protein [Erysipelotrichaceae bacterium]